MRLFYASSLIDHYFVIDHVRSCDMQNLVYFDCEITSIVVVVYWVLWGLSLSNTISTYYSVLPNDGTVLRGKVIMFVEF